MRKILYSFLGLSLLLVTQAAVGQTDSDSKYLKIDYIQVSPADQAKFMTLAKNGLKGTVKNNTGAESITDWHLYEVIYNGGDKQNYNFVSVSTSDDIDKFQKFDLDEFLVNHRNKSGNLLGTVVFSEIWKITNRVDVKEKREKPARYMAMDYMNVVPGKDSEYLLLEDDIARPIHQERIDRGKMVDWHVYNLIVPGGTEYGYNFATGNYFNEMSHIEFGFTNDVIIEAHPGLDIAELWNMVYSTRKMVSHELWELVAYVK